MITWSVSWTRDLVGHVRWSRERSRHGCTSVSFSDAICGYRWRHWSRDLSLTSWAWWSVWLITSCNRIYDHVIIDLITWSDRFDHVLVRTWIMFAHGIGWPNHMVIFHTAWPCVVRRRDFILSLILRSSLLRFCTSWNTPHVVRILLGGRNFWMRSYAYGVEWFFGAQNFFSNLRIPPNFYEQNIAYYLHILMRWFDSYFIRGILHLSQLKPRKRPNSIREQYYNTIWRLFEFDLHFCPNFRSLGKNWGNRALLSPASFAYEWGLVRLS